MAKVRIFSRSAEPFRDRLQAGQLLSEQMGELKGKKAVVLGIPRGGIVVAQSLAHGIEAEVDIVLSRKLGAPGHLELAIGALAETGELFLNRPLVQDLSVSDDYIEAEKQRQMAEIQRRNQLIRRVLPHIPLTGRIAIVTDDGVATGATMQAAVWAIKHEKPRSLIAALPVASEEAVNRLAGDVDEVICLRMPDDFMAVGQFYRDFEQITDEEVIQILKQEQEGKKTK